MVKLLYCVLYLSMAFTMSRPWEGLNCPPLKNRTVFVRRKFVVDAADMKLFDIELQTTKWECGETEWSKGWGKCLGDLSRTIKQLKSCVDMETERGKKAIRDRIN